MPSADAHCALAFWSTIELDLRRMPVSAVSIGFGRGPTFLWPTT